MEGGEGEEGEKREGVRRKNGGSQWLEADWNAIYGIRVSF